MGSQIKQNPATVCELNDVTVFHLNVSASLCIRAGRTHHYLRFEGKRKKEIFGLVVELHSITSAINMHYSIHHFQSMDVRIKRQ